MSSERQQVVGIQSDMAEKIHKTLSEYIERKRHTDNNYFNTINSLFQLEDFLRPMLDEDNKLIIVTKKFRLLEYLDTIFGYGRGKPTSFTTGDRAYWNEILKQPDPDVIPLDSVTSVMNSLQRNKPDFCTITGHSDYNITFNLRSGSVAHYINMWLKLEGGTLLLYEVLCNIFSSIVHLTEEH